MKRGVSVSLVLLVISTLCASSVLADLSVIFGPPQAYETTSNYFEINLTNVNSAYEISKVKAEMAGFNVTSMIDYEGWTSAYADTEAVWSDGLVSNNVFLAKFDFYATALPVDSETTKDAEIKLKDQNGDDHTFIFPITILNDETGPNMTVLEPQGGFVKQGETETTFTAQIIDEETGIESVTLEWQECGNENATRFTRDIVESEGLYTTTIDLSGYVNEDEVCYTLTAKNGGGDVEVHNGTLTIDNIPPEVTLISPLNEAVMGLNRNFSFFASDNLATDMRCSMYIDGIEYVADIAAQHMDVEFIPAADAEEGEHTWSVKCTDPAGWEGESAAWTYMLDKTPPVISMTAPGNNSIVADTTTLEFEVTDNFDLWNVYVVFNGTQSEVDADFSINVSSWPDGPSEFEVIAEDSVGNRAEQTYRIIVDRTPPSVVLVAPDDESESDVHVNFSYTAQDDYDDVIDCTVYIDDAGEEQHEALSSEETVHTQIVPIGEHRWNVQCVDDAGNQASGIERELSVIDTSGPDIEFDLPAEAQRGNPVQLSLHITDPSGVEAATATLRNPDNTTQTVPLERNDDTYTATIDTGLDWDLGTYMLVVYAVDTLNFSNQLEQSFELDYKYVVAIEVSPSTASPNSEVTASGTVIYDNTSLVPEEAVTLTLPGNVSVDVTLDNGDFTHSFTAPGADGVYEVTASVVSKGNSETYSDVAPLTVYTAPVQSGGSGGSGGGHGGYNRAADEPVICSEDWQCTAWNPCSDGTQARTCIDINHCGDDRRVESQSCALPEEEEEDDNDGTEEERTVTASREPLPNAEELEIDAPEKDKRITAGVGKASSFMNVADVKITDLLLMLGLMGMLMGILYKYGWSKGDNRNKPAAVDYLGSKKDRLGLENYLNERASRKRW